MTAARTVMQLMQASMPGGHRVWAEAMTAEFAEAERRGGALLFALGCLGTAWGQLPRHAAGRFLLSRYGLVLGIILPFATFHLGCARAGVTFLLTGHDPYLALMAAGNERQQAIATAYDALAPWLTLTLAGLGTGHLAVAWYVAACRWRAAALAMALTATIAALLVACIIAVHPTAKGMMLQGVALAIEAICVPLLALWQARCTDSIREGDGW